jgi:tetratricopeptide (TPR) repeat protein
VTDRAGHLSNLGSALQSRAEIADGDPADAPPVLRAAVAAAPPGSPHLPRFLSNLGNALLNAGDPNGAVGLHREALALLPDRHPDRSVVLGNLAAALSSTADDAALPEVMRAAQEIRDDATASGQDRLVAAWRLADLEVRISGGDVGRAAPAMRAALDLAERAAWIGVTRADRTYTLARFSSLALDAAAAVAVADPGTAITILESGRGIGWRDQLQQRRFDALAEHSPALADRLRAIGTALDRPLVV